MISFLIGCKQNTSTVSKIETTNTEEKVESPAVENKIPEKRKVQTSLSKLQGIWKGQKDLNQSIPYRIQYQKKILDILCIEGICDEGDTDNSVLELSYLGFVN